MNKHEIYKYKIYIEYEYNKRIYKFDESNIYSLFIDYNYKDLHMPVMIIQIALDKNMIDEMIDNMNKKHVIVSVYKYVDNVKVPIYKKYIHDKFIFILDKEKNKTKELDYHNIDKNKPVFKKISIGLVKPELVKNNKYFINDIFYNTPITNIIRYYSQNMKILIEPIDKDIDNSLKNKNCIIPPLDSFTNLIKYLDDNGYLYDTDYRLFYDYDKTYLLSSSGNVVESKDELISSVIINIQKTVKDESKIRGMNTNNNQNVYIIDVDTKDCHFLKNPASRISSDKKLYINTNGENNYNNIEPGQSVQLVRTQKKNFDKENKIKDDEVINISKTEIDTSIFTINKEYMIKNFTIDGYNEGKYILIRKRDVFIRENDNFHLLNILTFKKL